MYLFLRSNYNKLPLSEINGRVVLTMQEVSDKGINPLWTYTGNVMIEACNRDFNVLLIDSDVCKELT